jgi:2-C-methyl-D-erythritol 4-phosphate cytidylyltransferase
MPEKEYCTAIVLAAGRGSRMGKETEKQYLELGGKPMLYYSLRVFQDSPVIDEILLVLGEGREDFCREKVLKLYPFSKISKIIEGGEERYLSVWNALRETKETGYVFIHDGARPFLTEAILRRAFDSVRECKASVVGMPVKDTIKEADEDGIVQRTPDRSRVWQIQTPQVFEAALIRDAYARMIEKQYTQATDDAMAVEQMTGYPVKLVHGSYENIKITTPEDMELGELIARRLKLE